VALKLVRERAAQNKICYIRPNIEWTWSPQGFSTPNPILFITLAAFNYAQDLISKASSLSSGDRKGRFDPTTLQNKKKFSMPTPLLECYYAAVRRCPLEIFAFLFIKTYPLVERQIGCRRHTHCQNRRDLSIILFWSNNNTGAARKSELTLVHLCYSTIQARKRPRTAIGTDTAMLPHHRHESYWPKTDNSSVLRLGNTVNWPAICRLPFYTKWILKLIPLAWCLCHWPSIFKHIKYYYCYYNYY
jgi:hypothetical protein